MIKAIKTKSDYEAALVAIDELLDMDPDPGTAKADDLEVLSVLVQEYERNKYEKSLPDPVEAIQFRMEQQELTQRDLVPYIGSRSTDAWEQNVRNVKCEQCGRGLARTGPIMAERRPVGPVYCQQCIARWRALAGVIEKGKEHTVQVILFEGPPIPDVVRRGKDGDPAFPAHEDAHGAVPSGHVRVFQLALAIDNEREDKAKVLGMLTLPRRWSGEGNVDVTVTLVVESAQAPVAAGELAVPA